MKEMALVWLVTMTVLFIIEAVTVNLVTIWFAFGAMAALITCLAGGSVLLQVVLFTLVTVFTLVPTRKVAKKLLHGKNKEATNADRAIGKPCTVTQQINNLSGTGAVKCLGIDWSARSENDEIFEVGTVVTVTAIQGAKLIVK